MTHKFSIDEYTPEEKAINGNGMYGGKRHDEICDYLQASYSFSDKEMEALYNALKNTHALNKELEAKVKEGVLVIGLGIAAVSSLEDVIKAQENQVKELDDRLKGVAFDNIGLTKDLNNYIADHGRLLISKSQLEEKLKVAVEGLKRASWLFENVELGHIDEARDVVNEALEQIKAK
jgi:hypothetical protein